MEILEPFLGLRIYKNAMPNPKDIPKRLEELLSVNPTEIFKWNDVAVSFRKKDHSVRNCVDHKVNKLSFKLMSEDKKDLELVWQETKDAIVVCLNEYMEQFVNTPPLNYMESINFIKYEPGAYFKSHVDHGPSYSSVVSCVVYFNDDFEGGELSFPYFDNYTYRPEAGDILFFPSNIMYLHEAKSVISGTKYSAVTMFDFNDINHRLQTGDRTPAVKNY